MNRARTLLTTVLGLALLAGLVQAQEPKVGNDWYEDNTDLGFKIKVPKKWDFIPPQPLEVNLIGKYTAAGGNYVNLGGDAVTIPEMSLVKFDRREGKNEGKERQVGGRKVTISSKGSDSITTWMEDDIGEGTGWRMEKGYPKRLKGPKVDAEYYLYSGMSMRGRPGAEPKELKAYVALYHLSPEVDVALVGVGPGNKQWRAFEKSYSKMAKSLKPVEVEALAGSGDALDAHSPRGKKRMELEAKVANTPGWQLYETPNYFIISSYTDKQFIETMMERLEAIRAVYEVDYPAEKARKIKREDDEHQDDDEDDEDEERTISVINPMDLSRTSVVRVCKDVDEYYKYGGPPGTGGYWSWVDEELVIYDDKARRGTDWTWEVMNHEAFHQYIFYFYGNLAPHSWYNEGTGDYYSGFEYKRRKFKEKAENGRQRNIQEIIGAGRHVPLEEFVTWSKSQYYGSNDRGLAGHECYAQGWALIWFLRTGEKKAKGWDKSWNDILEVYLDTLAETGETEEAVEKAFEGVDWEKFEKSWLDYIG